MPPRPRLSFRGQAEEALAGFACIVTYLLFQVAHRTEVRTEGDRILVVVCTIGAAGTGAVLLALVVRGAIRRRRARVAARDGDTESADAPQAADPAEGAGS
ncbi:hypothetical protein [Clavibacter michiganensis]|uniref:hypothetical protein n=1 Tax=Clavibacter michiganensis TaxID=28447 RepID=UPI003EB8D1BC